jgi:hypothetical protein
LVVFERAKRQPLDVPWFFVLGSSADTRRRVLRGSGLRIGTTIDDVPPLRWHLTGQAVFLDADAEALSSDESLGNLCKLLCQCRADRPLSGLVLCDPGDAEQRVVAKLPSLLRQPLSTYVLVAAGQKVPEAMNVLATQQPHQMIGMTPALSLPELVERLHQTTPALFGRWPSPQIRQTPNDVEATLQTQESWLTNDKLDVRGVWIVDEIKERLLGDLFKIKLLPEAGRTVSVAGQRRRWRLKALQAVAAMGVAGFVATTAGFAWARASTSAAAAEATEAWKTLAVWHERRPKIDLASWSPTPDMLQRYRRLFAAEEAMRAHPFLRPPPADDRRRALATVATDDLAKPLVYSLLDAVPMTPDDEAAVLLSLCQAAEDVCWIGSLGDQKGWQPKDVELISRVLSETETAAFAFIEEPDRQRQLSRLLAVMPTAAEPIDHPAVGQAAEAAEAWHRLTLERPQTEQAYERLRQSLIDVGAELVRTSQLLPISTETAADNDHVSLLNRIASELEDSAAVEVRRRLNEEIARRAAAEAKASRRKEALAQHRSELLAKAAVVQKTLPHLLPIREVEAVPSLEEPNLRRLLAAAARYRDAVEALETVPTLRELETRIERAGTGRVRLSRLPLIERPVEVAAIYSPQGLAAVKNSLLATWPDVDADVLPTYGLRLEYERLLQRRFSVYHHDYATTWHQAAASAVDVQQATSAWATMTADPTEAATLLADQLQAAGEAGNLDDLTSFAAGLRQLKQPSWSELGDDAASAGKQLSSLPPDEVAAEFLDTQECLPSDLRQYVIDVDTRALQTLADAQDAHDDGPRGAFPFPLAKWSPDARVATPERLQALRDDAAPGSGPTAEELAKTLEQVEQSHGPDAAAAFEELFAGATEPPWVALASWLLDEPPPTVAVIIPSLDEQRNRLGTDAVAAASFFGGVIINGDRVPRLTDDVRMLEPSPVSTTKLKIVAREPGDGGLIERTVTVPPTRWNSLAMIDNYFLAVSDDRRHVWLRIPLAYPVPGGVDDRPLLLRLDFEPPPPAILFDEQRRDS